MMVVAAGFFMPVLNCMAMDMNHTYSILLFALLSITTQPIGADIYKWVDEQGNVHYGDKPVTGDDAEAVDLQLETTRTDVGSERAEMREKLIDVMQEDREEKAELRKQKLAERKARMKECTRLKKNLDRLRHAGSVYRKGEDGERSYFSKEKRAQAEAKFRKRIRQVCR